MINCIIGIICGFAGGMNLVVGNTAIGVMNVILAFINFAFWAYFRDQKKKERQAFDDMARLQRLYLKEVKTDERKNEFGMESNEDWLAQLCQQSKRSNSKQA